jgi:general secretion pathway protein D
VAWLRTEVARIKRHERLVAEAQQSLDAERFEKAESGLRSVLTEDPANGKARAMLSRIEELREGQTRRQGSLQLATGQKPVTLEFREASLRTVFEALARAADINFVFDKDVRSDAKVTLFLRGTSVDEAMRVILNTQQLGYKLLNENTVLVFPATQQKQRDVLDTVTRTFYLVNADPKQAQSLVRTVAKTRDIYIDERLNLLIVRDTPEVMRLVERLIQNIDLADPEVMLELEVMEVSNNQLESLGISWPSSVSYGLPGSATQIATRSGLQAFTANPLAVATLQGAGANTNILANPKIRARNREKAHVLLGEKLPVFTTTSTPGFSGNSTAVSINYVDVGLKLDVEPQVQLDNDVTIKVALEVSSITNKVSGPAGSFAYQVGTRQANTTLRLRDGETQVLAGLINDSESRSTAGLPYLHDTPILGRLFGVTTDERKKSEIVLLVTPHIIRNVVQPPVSGTALPSGTESQPGAATMVLRESAAMSGVGTPGAGSAPSPRSAARSRGRSLNQVLAGPEEVLPGASFTVSVRNPDATPMQASLSVDTTVLAIESPQVQGGRLAVNVPPNGTVTVMVHVLPGVVEADTSIELDNGQEPLKLRVRAAPGEPGANPAAAAPMGFDPDSPNPQ